LNPTPKKSEHAHSPENGSLILNFLYHYQKLKTSFIDYQKIPSYNDRNDFSYSRIFLQYFCFTGGSLLLIYNLAGYKALLGVIIFTIDLWLIYRSAKFFAKIF